MAEKQDLARRFMVAYLEGVRDYVDGFFKGDAAKKAAVVKALVENTNIQDPAAFERMGMPAVNPNGKVNVESLRRDMELFRQIGLVQAPADLTKLVDHSFVEAAVKVLGEYR